MRSNWIGTVTVNCYGVLWLELDELDEALNGPPDEIRMGYRQVGTVDALLCFGFNRLANSDLSLTLARSDSVRLFWLVVAVVQRLLSN